MYPFGSLKFRSKDALKAHVKPVIESLGICEIPPEHERFSFMIDLFRNHPDSKQVIPLKFSREIADYGSLVFFYHTCDKKVDFSWDMCCFNFKSRKECLNNTLRNTVKPYMDEFRRSLPKEECKFCQSTIKVQIDHIYPFSCIRDEFLKDRVDIPTNFQGNIFLQFKPADEAFKTDWIAHHNKIATYQPLCKVCNSRKSNRVG